MMLLDAVDENRQGRSQDAMQLLHEIETMRQERQEGYVLFLQDLLPSIEIARKVDRDRDLQSADRFNALRYLRYDELGLSKIVADLLDPSSEHGQGTIFLEAMLEILFANLEESDAYRTLSLGKREPTLSEHGSILVQTERVIDDRRKIDITVDIPTYQSVFCLAFENKPYANDQNEQCKDYLEFLKEEYDNNFLFIYVPAGMWMPSVTSLPDPDSWIRHFRVLPYVSDHNNANDVYLSNEFVSAGYELDSSEDKVNLVPSGDDLSRFLIGEGVSLADWFQECEVRANAERLRWFLSEAQSFCRQQFGVPTMINAETRFIKEHLELHPDQSSSAYAVYLAWPEYTHWVREEFRRQLAEKAVQKLQLEHGALTVKSHFEDEDEDVTVLTIYDERWPQYDADKNHDWFHYSELRTSITLDVGRIKGNIYFGVMRPKSRGEIMKNKSERDRQENLGDLLKEKGLYKEDDEYLYWEYPKKYSTWTEIIPDLALEIQRGEGEITGYLVDCLLQFIRKVVTTIDQEGKVEKLNSSS